MSRAVKEHRMASRRPPPRKLRQLQVEKGASVELKVTTNKKNKKHTKTVEKVLSTIYTVNKNQSNKFNNHFLLLHYSIAAKRKANRSFGELTLHKNQKLCKRFLLSAKCTGTHSGTNSGYQRDWFVEKRERKKSLCEQ